ncbi:hypothetical protein ANN_17263 [Periplaneta americana]|uniref:Uncharacterized protein n=1 Tax=Periplaneta americana TaxID=6978 RepID=A0ABQ8SSF6_PERAM|nr:hypothetical protein ANN_17263 [Periplaneta americana]
MSAFHKNPDQSNTLEIVHPITVALSLRNCVLRTVSIFYSAWPYSTAGGKQEAISSRMFNELLQDQENEGRIPREFRIKQHNQALEDFLTSTPDWPRKEAIAKFRLQTGHDILAKHLYRFGLLQTLTCKLCNLVLSSHGKGNVSGTHLAYYLDDRGEHLADLTLPPIWSDDPSLLLNNFDVSSAVRGSTFALPGLSRHGRTDG